MVTDILNLGVRIDGWADIVEGAADKAEEARSAAEMNFMQKEMPGVSVGKTTYNTKRERTFVVLDMPNGATITMYIGSFGKDLYAAWDLYIRPVLNKELIFIVLGLAAFIGLAGGNQVNFYGQTTFSLLGWISSTLAFAIGVFMLIGLAGFVAKRNVFAYFFKELDLFDVDDIAAMGLEVHKGLMHALDSIGISSNTLRIKEQFHAGSRERVI